MMRATIALVCIFILCLTPDVAQAVVEPLPAAGAFSWARYLASILLCVLLAGVAVVALYLARNGMSIFDSHAYRQAIGRMASSLKSARPDLKLELLSVLDQKRISVGTTATVLRCGQSHFLIVQAQGGQPLIQELDVTGLPSTNEGAQ